MRKFTIEAASLQSAREIEAALKGFERELLADGSRHCVQVRLPSGDDAIVAVLNAVEAFVQGRGEGPARIEYAGKNYTMEAAPSH